MIFHAAGKTGDGVFAAARQRKARAIGVDSDQFDAAPCCVVTSMVKRVDVAVVDIIKDIIAAQVPRRPARARAGRGRRRRSSPTSATSSCCRSTSSQRVEASSREDIIAGKIVVPDR